MKVGDHVIYIKHCEWTSETLRVDKLKFTIGNVYKIKTVDRDLITFDGIYREVMRDQVEKVIDSSKLNKVLYPEFIEYGKYLIPKETYEIIAHKKK
jgi:hypothetical protein